MFIDDCMVKLISVLVGCSGCPCRCMNIFRILTRGVGMGSVLENKQTDRRTTKRTFLHALFLLDLNQPAQSGTIQTTCRRRDGWQRHLILILIFFILFFYTRKESSFILKCQILVLNLMFD